MHNQTIPTSPCEIMYPHYNQFGGLETRLARMHIGSAHKSFQIHHCNVCAINNPRSNLSPDHEVAWGVGG